MMSSLVFKVRRSEAVVVQPARSTPMEVKTLSDWDNQAIARFPTSAILLYKQSATDKDPAKTVKRALAEALVYYYPWAGRLKEGTNGKLLVDCTADGVVFVEADADVRLDQFSEDSLGPPFPCIEELLYSKDPTAVDEIPELGSPLFSMQVTRLLCGGFILAFTFEHVISDGFGAALFLTAVAELAADGATAPSVLPIWQREELLNARDPPRVPLSESLNIFNAQTSVVDDDHNGVDVGAYRTFFFGSREVSSIRARIPESIRDSYTAFELIVACVVHCRIASLQYPPGEQVRVLFPVNCRGKFVDRPIPAGYYGNASFPATFVCSMRDLHDLGRAVELVKKAKEEVNEEYARSLLDIEVIRRRSPAPNMAHNCPTYLFTDWSRIGFSTLDFGPWGKPMYVGTRCNVKFRHVVSFMVPFTNQKGEEGRLLDLYMSIDAMDKFSIMLRTLLGPII